MAKIRVKRFGRYEAQTVDVETIGEALEATRQEYRFEASTPLMLRKDHHLFRDPGQRVEDALELLSVDRRVDPAMDMPFFEVLPRLVALEIVWQGRRILVSLPPERSLREAVDRAVVELGAAAPRGRGLAATHAGRLLTNLDTPLGDAVRFGPDNYPVTFVLELVETG